MTESMPITSENMSDKLHESFGTPGVYWIGALSFERRCLGSAMHLRDTGIPVRNAVAFEYNTRVSPADEANRVILDNTSYLRELLRPRDTESVRVRPLVAHSITSVQSALTDALVESEADHLSVVIDITCLTRLHVIGLAAGLAGVGDTEPLAIAYSLPDNYVTMAEDQRAFRGYERVMVAPLAAMARLGNESKGRGIILAGHERQRLLIALAEIEPPHGVFVRPMTSFRPDFSHANEYRNRATTKRLSHFGRWRIEQLEFSAVDEIVQLVTTVAEEAKAQEGPLFLYPFGPKSLVFAAALAAARSYPEGSWVVYPIPSYYDAGTTEGLDRTFWWSNPHISV
jgi:hypothetical protein